MGADILWSDYVSEQTTNKQRQILHFLALCHITYTYVCCGNALFDVKLRYDLNRQFSCVCTVTVTGVSYHKSHQLPQYHMLASSKKNTKCSNNSYDLINMCFLNMTPIVVYFHLMFNQTENKEVKCCLLRQGGASGCCCGSGGRFVTSSDNHVSFIKHCLR